MLIDLWAKLDQPRAVYSDLTRASASSATTVPEKYAKIFDIVAAARDAGIKTVQDAFAAKHAAARAGRSTTRPAR